MSSDTETASDTDTASASNTDTASDVEVDGAKQVGVGDPSATETKFGADDWARIYHGVLSVHEAENRLTDFGICGGFLVRKSPLKSERLVISFLSDKVQVKHVLPPVTKRSNIVTRLESSEKKVLALHVLNSMKETQTVTPIPSTFVNRVQHNRVNNICLACENQFDTQQRLNAHIRSHHSVIQFSIQKLSQDLSIC